MVTSAPDGHERILAICSPDDFIGEAFLQEAQVYRVDAVGLTPAVTCSLSREQFLGLALRALSFAEILASHLFGCREQLSYAYDPAKQRLVRVRAGRALREAARERLVRAAHRAAPR